MTIVDYRYLIHAQRRTAAQAKEVGSHFELYGFKIPSLVPDLHVSVDYSTLTQCPPELSCPPGHEVITCRKLCDTGCPYDLISPCDLRPVDLNYVELGDAVTLQTVSGPLAVNQVVAKQAPRLKSESMSCKTPQMC